MIGGSWIGGGIVGGTGVLVKTKLIEWRIEVLRIGIDLVGWLKSD